MERQNNKKLIFFFFMKKSILNKMSSNGPYYKFITSYYFDSECKELQSKIIEVNICDSRFGDVNKCCTFVSYLKNVTLNVCSGLSEYSCSDGSADYETDYSKDWQIMGILIMVFLLSCSMYGITLVLWKNCRKSDSIEYVPLV